MRDFAQVKYDGKITLEVANYALDLMEVDKLGLDNIDRAIYMKVAKVLVGAGWVKLLDKDYTNTETWLSFVGKVRQEIQKDNANNARKIGIKANLTQDGGNGGL